MGELIALKGSDLDFNSKKGDVYCRLTFIAMGYEPASRPERPYSKPFDANYSASLRLSREQVDLLTVE